MAAPPSAAIKPAAPKPVSRAMAAACPLLLLDLNVLVALVALAADACPLLLLVVELPPLVDVTGQLIVQGMSLVNGRLATELADAKAGT